GINEGKELDKLKKKAENMSYVEEQEMLKKSIRFGDEERVKEEEENDEDGDFFSLRNKSKKEIQQEEEKFQIFQNSEEGKKIAKVTVKNLNFLKKKNFLYFYFFYFFYFLLE